MIRTKSALLSIFVISSCLYAGDVDLRPYFGPPRNQGTMGWCYAYSIADLLTYHHREELGIQAPNGKFYLSRRVSAFDIANSYNHSLRGSVISGIGRILDNSQSEFRIKLKYTEGVGGSFKLPYRLAVSKGLCLEEQVRSENLMDHFDSYSSLRFPIAKLRKAAIDGKTLTEYESFKIGEIFPALSTREIADIIESTGRDVINQLVSQSCKERVAISRSRLKMDTFLIGKKNLLRKANQLLEGAKPVLISYRMKLFDRTLTGLHANLIVGKKWDDEKQDWNYILRNTYGDRCSELHKKKGQISESEMLKVRACQRKKNCLPQEAGGEYEDYYRNAHFAGCQSDCMKTLARGNYQTCRKKCENERITLYTECKATCYPMRNQNLQCEKGYLTVSGPELRRYLMSIAYVD